VDGNYLILWADHPWFAHNDIPDFCLLGKEKIMEKELPLCNYCHKPVAEGEMTHVQTKPAFVSHWNCHRRFVEEKVKQGVDYYESRRRGRLVA
jgi:hypothetical protein